MNRAEGAARGRGCRLERWGGRAVGRLVRDRLVDEGGRMADEEVLADAVDAVDRVLHEELRRVAEGVAELRAARLGQVRARQAAHLELAVVEGFVLHVADGL